MLLLAFMIVVNLVDGDRRAPIINLPEGDIVGRILQTETTEVHFYQGIRFGQVSERFERPEPVKPWSGIYEATTPREKCPQLGNYNPDQPNEWASKLDENEGPPSDIVSGIIGEDCLYLNLFRPIVCSNNQSCPVMVWVYGGGFLKGSIFSKWADGRYLAAHGDLIFVAINYRLGPFGFLFNNDTASGAPGNQALHDLLLGLRWIQNNIERFGGDPGQVTLAGQSAGAMLVGDLIFSPLAAGLFHRAIIQSGAPMTAVTDQPTACRFTINLARRMGCRPFRRSGHQIVRCLRSKSMGEILASTKRDVLMGRLMRPIFGDLVLPSHPTKALNSGQLNQVDIMFGVTKHEGSGFIKKYLVAALPALAKNPTLTLPLVRAFIYTLALIFNEKDQISVVHRYTAQLNPHDQLGMRLAMANAFGHYNLVCPTLYFGERAAIAGRTVYGYHLTTPLSFKNGTTCDTLPDDVCHGEDLAYLFLVPTNPDVYSERDKELSREIIDAWSRFVHTGNPERIGNVSWNKSGRTLQLMEIDSINLPGHRMVDDPYTDICHGFWRPRLFPNVTKTKKNRS